MGLSENKNMSAVNLINSDRHMQHNNRSRAFTHPPLYGGRYQRHKIEYDGDQHVSQVVDSRSSMESLSHSQSLHALNEQADMKVTFIDEIAEETVLEAATVTPQESPNYHAQQPQARNQHLSNANDSNLLPNMEIDISSQEIPASQVHFNHSDALSIPMPNESMMRRRDYDRAFGYPVVRPRVNHSEHRQSRAWTSLDPFSDLPLIPSLSSSLEQQDSDLFFPTSSSPPCVTMAQPFTSAFPLSIHQVGNVSFPRFAPRSNRSRSLLRRPNPEHHASFSLRDALELNQNANQASVQNRDSLSKDLTERHSTTLVSSFPWKKYPKLELYLIENSEEYYNHFAPERITQQSSIRDQLTERLLNFAIQNDYTSSEDQLFHLDTLRNAIYSFYKNNSRSHQLSIKQAQFKEVLNVT